MIETQEKKKIALNTLEAVEYLGINRKLLEAYRRAGLIKAIKTGRSFIYPVKELDGFIEQNTGKEITKDGLILGSM